MRHVRLTELASVVRSKNAGPFELTFDVFLKSRAIYRVFKERRLIDRPLVARLYGVAEERIRDVIYFDPACAVKVTIARPVPSGSPADTDVYGAQQHAPLLDLQIP